MNNIDGCPTLISTESDIECCSIEKTGTPIYSIGPITSASTIAFGLDFRTAIRKEIQDYLIDKIFADVIRWKDDSQMITVQVSIENHVIGEKTFLLE